MTSIDTVQRIYAAFARGDLDAVMVECEPDTVVTQDSSLPWGGRYVGRDGIAEFALKLIGAIDSTVAAEEIFQAGDKVVQHGRSQGTVRDNGVQFDVAECHVWTVHNNRVAAAEFYIDSTAMHAALTA